MKPVEPTRRGLASAFARRMAPVAVLVGLLAATGPPLLYGGMAWQRLDGQASVYADRVARALAIPATRQPQLWRYNAHKVVQAAASTRAIQELGAVRVTDCQGRTLFSSQELELGTGRQDGPVGWAPVVVNGQAVAWARVAMDAGGLADAVARIALGSGLLGLLLGLTLFFFPVRVVRRQGAALEETLARLEEAEAELVGANAQLQRRVAHAVAEVRELSGRVVSIQERERRRIAMDLHDGVGQLVTALRMELDLARRTGDEAHRDKALALCDTIVGEIRTIVRDLRPLELEAMGLELALRHHVERFEARTGVVVGLRWVGPAVEDEDVAVALLRVVQEALHNVSRHASATEVGVSLRVESGAVMLDVEDDGEGFDPAAPAAGAGLKGIRERAAFLGGEVSIDAAPGQGVRISVRLPLSDLEGRG